MSDIINLIKNNINLGSCPQCGKPIWSSYQIFQDSESLRDSGKEIFKCLYCQYIMLKESIIPF